MGHLLVDKHNVKHTEGTSLSLKAKNTYCEMFSSWDEMEIVGVFFILFFNSHYIGGHKILIFLYTQDTGNNEAHPLSPSKWQRKQYLSVLLFYCQY